MQIEGQNLINFEDPNGVKYVQELIAAAAAGGGFVEYYFDNPAIDENGDGELTGDPIGSPKISYAIPITDSTNRPGIDLTLRVLSTNTRRIIWSISIYRTARNKKSHENKLVAFFIL